MRETVRSWDKQRKKWYKELDTDGATACSCGKCAKGSPYRAASSSPSKLREYMHAPCGGKADYPELAIEHGPKSSRTVQFYKRQCSRAPLPAVACAHNKPGDKKVCGKCADCGNCGWDKVMLPACPVEQTDGEAWWLEYQPRIEPDGTSYGEHLVTVKGTRKQLMELLRKLWMDWSPHIWIDQWLTHQRHLTYATFPSDEMCISTDFSAQYEHKAAFTRTCEHPGRSNIDVFVVTHSPRMEGGERVVDTDVWRIFSEAKGSALFHNAALDLIVEHYREKVWSLPLGVC
jgi:hypothetical protein